MKSLLAYDLKCFGRDGTEWVFGPPATYRSSDPQLRGGFQDALLRLAYWDVLYAGGKDEEDWRLPAESPAAELWNSGECAVRITLDMEYLAARTDPARTLPYDLMQEYGRRREGLYFDVFSSAGEYHARNGCEAEYMAMFDAALAQYERRTEPGDPVEVKWRPKLYLDGFYRPLELADQQDFAAKQGELYDWYNAPYRLVWDQHNHSHPYGLDISRASKEGSVIGVMREVERHTAIHWQHFAPQGHAQDESTLVRARGRDNCVLHLAEHDWTYRNGFDRMLFTACAEVFNEDKPDYAAAPKIVELLDRAIVRFEKNEAAGRKFRRRTVFV